jgi:hypothetical protein
MNEREMNSVIQKIFITPSSFLHKWHFQGNNVDRERTKIIEGDFEIAIRNTQNKIRRLESNINPNVGEIIKKLKKLSNDLILLIQVNNTPSDLLESKYGHNAEYFVNLKQKIFKSDNISIDDLKSKLAETQSKIITVREENKFPTQPNVKDRIPDLKARLDNLLLLIRAYNTPTNLLQNKFGYNEAYFMDLKRQIFGFENVDRKDLVSKLRETFITMQTELPIKLYVMFGNFKFGTIKTFYDNDIVVDIYDLKKFKPNSQGKFKYVNKENLKYCEQYNRLINYENIKIITYDYDYFITLINRKQKEKKIDFREEMIKKYDEIDLQTKLFWDEQNMKLIEESGLKKIEDRDELENIKLGDIVENKGDRKSQVGEIDKRVFEDGWYRDEPEAEYIKFTKGYEIMYGKIINRNENEYDVKIFQYEVQYILNSSKYEVNIISDTETTTIQDRNILYRTEYLSDLKLDMIENYINKNKITENKSKTEEKNADSGKRKKCHSCNKFIDDNECFKSISNKDNKLFEVYVCSMDCFKNKDWNSVRGKHNLTMKKTHLK